jgi:hypothetical protein
VRESAAARWAPRVGAGDSVGWPVAFEWADSVDASHYRVLLLFLFFFYSFFLSKFKTSI